MDTGGYDAMFTEDPPEIFKCIICQLVLKNPVMFVECSHRVCGTCFKQLREYTSRGNLLCPLDRIQVDVDKVVIDKGISRSILDLKVKCENSTVGCSWVGELRHAEQHCDKSCHFNASKRNSRLIEQLLRRMEACENKLKKKDDEIVSVTQKFQSEIKKLQQQVVDLKNQVGKLSDDNGAEPNKIGCRIERCTCAAPASIGGKVSPAKSIKSSETASPGPYRIIHQERMMNVDEYIPNDRTVFRWRIKNYATERSKGELLSPKFYCRPNGPCCHLLVQWLGERKGRLAVGFFTLKELDSEHGDTTPFDMSVTLETTSKNGQKHREVITKDEMMQADIGLEGDILDICGMRGHFLNMPELRNYIIHDTLTITCTLSEE